MYTIKVALDGFKTIVADNVELIVDTNTRQDFTVEVGNYAEIVNVVGESSRINTSDASVGTSFTREQIRNLPVEAQNVVHLLSLQAGASSSRDPPQAGGDERTRDMARSPARARISRG